MQGADAAQIHSWGVAVGLLGPDLSARLASPRLRHRWAALVLEGDPVMLAFLIGTSIFNIFLGYALAVYLMRESLTLENHRRQGSYPKTNGAAVGEQRERSDLYPSSGAPAPTLEPASGSTPSSGNGPTTPSDASAAIANGDAAPATADAMDRGPEEMDQQLLAGIADFRSQLAKLRSETGSEEPKRRPVARTNK